MIKLKIEFIKDRQDINKKPNRITTAVRAAKAAITTFKHTLKTGEAPVLPKSSAELEKMQLNSDVVSYDNIRMRQQQLIRMSDEMYKIPDMSHVNVEMLNKILRSVFPKSRFEIGPVEFIAKRLGTEFNATYTSPERGLPIREKTLAQYSVNDSIDAAMDGSGVYIKEDSITLAFVAKNGLSGYAVLTGKVNEGDRIMADATRSAIVNIMNHHIEVKELQEKADIDGLTGLIKHESIISETARECTKAIRSIRDKKDPDETSVIFLDLDHFKTVNDTHGHIVGDQAIVRFVDVIKKHIRSTDTAGRYGGEEFVVLCPNTTVEEASIVAERIRHEMETVDIEITGSRIGETKLRKTVSIGIAAFPKNFGEEGIDLTAADAATEAATKLIDLADQALYAAKDGGRNRVVIYSSGAVEQVRQEQKKNEQPEDPESVKEEKLNKD